MPILRELNINDGLLAALVLPRNELFPVLLDDDLAFFSANGDNKAAFLEGQTRNRANRLSDIPQTYELVGSDVKACDHSIVASHHDGLLSLAQDCHGFCCLASDSDDRVDSLGSLFLLVSNLSQDEFYGIAVHGANKETPLVAVQIDDVTAEDFEWKSVKIDDLTAAQEVLVPQVDTSEHCSECQAFEAFAHG